MLGLGVVLGVVVCTLTPTNTPEALWFIFLSGAIAICAMILPGISGSFILLILGKYHFIMNTISEFTKGVNFGQNLLVIIVFMVGAIVGILGFSKFLRWLLARWNKETLLVLAGFIIGSLVKVWPWSNTGEIIKSQYPEIGLLFGNKPLPATVIEQYKDVIDLQVPSAIFFAAIGFLLVIGIEYGSKVIASQKK
jgi:putative membrane protein